MNIPTRSILVMVLMAMSLTASAAEPGAQATLDAPDPEAPKAGWIRVQLAPEADGAPRQACYRREQRAGFRWLSGALDADGRWLQGHWRPIAERAGHVWVPGHPGTDGRWAIGFWRLASVDGFVWIDGYWLEGVWHYGHWRPLAPRQGYVWVHGEVIDGTWRLGQWRASARAGSVWVPAHWRGGAWTRGFWYVGVWAWAPHDKPVPFAEPVASLETTNRDLIKKIIRPRYVAYLLTAEPKSEGRAANESDKRDRRPEKKASKAEKEERPSKARRDKGKRYREARPKKRTRRALPLRPFRAAPRRGAPKRNFAPRPSGRR